VPSTTRSRSLAVVVLAAGRGKRLKSRLPKVLHQVCGRPALWHVLNAARAAKPDRIVLVVHHGAEQVEQAVRSWDLVADPIFVDQAEPLGTGHAVGSAEEAIGNVNDVLVLAGDDPLVEGRHVRSVLAVHRRTRAAATILTSVVDDPKGYARVVRDRSKVVEIVQEADASPGIASIDEIATLVVAFARTELFSALPHVGRANRQHEYYLPDVFAILRERGERVSAVLGDFDTWAGVNSRASIATLTRVMRERINEAHLENGVTIVDPSQTYIDVDVRIGADTTIEPSSFLRGSTQIGAGCTVGPLTTLIDSRLGDGVKVPHSYLQEAYVEDGGTVGPFAYLRPGAHLHPKAKAGTFVEIKNSEIGPGTKVPHLSYIGDADIGEGTNIGAGNITANYDGREKHRTTIGSRVKTSVDTMFVAPVTVGDDAYTAAGSVITEDVPPGALGIARERQTNIEGYAERRKS
jgi:bifunctional UDP-N-acetylglucosamine pyrophosphorylase / glucosamine-1-phosphate N-acetyltransferase